MSNSKENKAVAANSEHNEITTKVLNKISKLEELGQLHLPKDYSAANALQAAFLILSDTTVQNQGNKPILEVTTKESQAQALFKMITDGLNPAKKHGDFIAYGNKMVWQREYFGNLVVAKRDADVKEVLPMVIYENDVFEYKIVDGVTSITKHEQKFENIDTNKIKGAYAVVVFNDGTYKTEIMNYHQIKTAWNQGAMKGNSPAHKNFPDQMAIKTVCNRAIKLAMNSSDDSELFATDPNIDSSRQIINNESATVDINFEEAGAGSVKEITEKTETIDKKEASTVDKDGQHTAKF